MRVSYTLVTYLLELFLFFYLDSISQKSASFAPTCFWQLFSVALLKFVIVLSVKYLGFIS